MTKASARSWIAVVAAALAAIGIGPAAAVVGPSNDGSSLASGIVMVLNHAGRTAGFCTGVVVAPTVVMTAAHCVPPGAELRVYYPDPGHDPVMLPIRAVALNPDYRRDAIKKRERSIDLAMVRLAAPLPGRFVPVRLAESGVAKLGARFTIAGYGVAREEDAASSGQLRTTVLQARAPLSAVLLWADDPAHAGSGACTGDSGAPVMADASTAVTALVVWSAGSAGRQCGDLTQALWLAPQRPWIERVLQTWDAAPAL